MSTPFDEDSVEMLYELGVKGFKVASCDLNNFPLLEKISKTKLPILLSTGASNIDEIIKTVKFIENKGSNKICIMQCTLCYPTKAIDANISAVNQLRKIFSKYLIGLSDHTLGINIASASVLSGVRVIEKHFTINKSLKKSADHWMSINPAELKKLRDNTYEILKAIGCGTKKVLDCEKNTRLLSRRSLVAKFKIYKGENITRLNVIPKRPSTGIPPSKMKLI